MSIQVDVVRICGFRGIENTEVSLPRVTVLFGQNNAGKTSVIKALQLALGDYSRYLSDEDFHISATDEQQDSITIDLRVIALDKTGKPGQFEDKWVDVFGDAIQSDPSGRQYFALRTIAKPDKIKGGFNIERFHLNAWPAQDGWQVAKVDQKNKFVKRLDAIPFISIDAQRDIHSELKEKSSFIGRVLASVEYDAKDVAELEGMVAAINKQAIEKSVPLNKLKEHLDTLNQSFDGAGKTELTPFPKKIRDLSKRFGVHFGETDKSSFSMEYHGMGTRSWASMLTVKAFTELMAKTHDDEKEPFFPIIAAEEPEAHLHPNAQRTLFEQLQSSSGQVIISTHSPYVIGISNLQNLRGLVRLSGKVVATELISGLDAEETNMLHREVMRFRGELLFSKAIILFEGVTEEQLIPAMFSVFFKRSAFASGVNCISVGGKNYAPFVKMALSFGIPVCIVSDNDGDTEKEIKSQIKKIIDEKKLTLSDNNFSLNFLNSGHDIEAELVHVQGIRDEIVEALVKAETKGSENPKYIAAKTAEIQKLNNDQLVELMRSAKASYAGFLAEVIATNKKSKPIEVMIPKAVIDSFNKLKEWK